MRLSTSAASRRKRRHVLSVASVAAAQVAAPFAMMGLLSQQAEAATYFWDINGVTTTSTAATGTWTAASTANWSTAAAGNIATAAVTTTNADDLTFVATGMAAATITVSGTQAAHSITFGNVNAAFTVSGGTAINLGNATAGSGIFNTVASGETVSTPLILNSAATAIGFSTSSTGGLTIGGAVTGAATTGTQLITVGASNTGGIALNGVIGNGSAGGVVGLTINSAGAGATTLAGANTYTGGTTLTAGTLNLNNAAALGGTAGLFTINGGTINNSTAAAITLANNNAQVWGGNFAFTGTSGLNLGTGAVNMTGSRTVTVNANTLTVGGVISGAASVLTKAGAGTLALSGANTYGGGTVVSTGALSFLNTAAKSATGTHDFAAGTTLGLGVSGASAFTATDIDNAFAGSMTGSLSGITVAATANIGIDTTNGSFTYANNGPSSTRGLTKLGANTLTITGANAYDGPTLIMNGTLSAASLNSVVGGTASSNLGAPTTAASGTISLGSTNTAGTLSYTGTGETTDRVINLAGTTGGGVLDQSGAGLLKFTSNLTFTGAGTKTLTLSGSTAGTGEISGTIAGSFSNTGTASTTPFTIAKTGTGTWTLSGTGNTAATLSINGGTLDTGSGITLGNAGAGTINTAGAVAGSTVTINGPITLAGVGAAANGADIGSTVAGVTLVLNGVISGGATNNIDFWSAPAGTTILNGANTFSGQVAVAGQIVQVTSLNSVVGGAASSSLGAPTTAATGTILMANAATTGTLRYVGTGETTDRVIALQGTTGGGVLDQSGTGLLKFTSAFTAPGAGIKVLTLQGSTAGTGEIAGAVVDNTATNTTGITKTGTGTWTLSGVNTYTGPTNVNGGILSLAGASGSIASNVTINGATFLLDNLAGANSGTRLADAGTITLAAGGTLDFSNDAAAATNYSETTGVLNINTGGGTIIADQAAVGQTSSLTFASLANTSGATLNFTGTGLGVDARNRVLFTAQAPGNLPVWARYNTTDFAAYDATNGIVAATYTDINTMSSVVPNTAGATVRINNVAGVANNTLGATTTTINALIQNATGPSTLDMGTTGILRTTGIVIEPGKQSLTIGATAGDGTLTAATAGALLNLSNNSSNTLTINSAIANNTSASNVVVSGTGVTTLAGANTYTGNTIVTGGTLNITGSLTGLVASSALRYGDTPGNTVVNISGNVNNYFVFTGSNAVGSTTVMNQTAGSVTIVPTTGADVQWVAKSGYGGLNITGGTFNTGRFDVVAPGGTAGVGVVYVGGGGTLNNNVGDWLILPRTNGIGQLTVGPGGNLVRSAAVTAQLAITMDGTGSYGALNVAGGNVDTGTRAIQFGFGTVGAGNQGFLNLAGGTLSVGLAINETGTAGSTAEYFNFAGGTLKMNAALASFIPATSIAGHTSTSTIYGPITNNNNGNAAFNTQIGSTSNFTGGLTVDTNGFATTFTNAFRAASGFAVTQANIGDVSALPGNSGYIGAPAVVFSAPAAGGVPASGYAVIDAATGKVNGIVITNPGTYALNETPTITLSGGGGSIAAFTTSALSTANTAAGITKTGLGTLTLSNASSTYTGGVTINQGTLALGIANAIPGANNVVVNGGTFDATTFANAVNGVSLQSGTIQGSTGVITSATDYDLRSGTVGFTGAGGLGGSVNVTKSTAGTVTLTGNGLGSFANTININNGTVAFSGATQLGNATATNTIGVNGGTLSFTGSTSVALGASQVVTIGSGGGTFDASNPLGVLTVAGGASGTGNLTKTGPGQVTFAGTTTLGTGSVAVSGGTLRAGFGASGTPAISISATGSLSMQNSAIQVLTLGNTAGALTLNGGAALGFELDGTTNDKINVGASGTALTTAGVITLNFFNFGSGVTAGTYDLLTAPSGLLPIGVSYVVGTAPSGFNYSLTATNQLVQLTASQFQPLYWTNSQTDGSWATSNAGPLTNFSTDVAGVTNATTTPGAANTVIFNASSVAGGTVNTTLNGNYTIYSLNFVNNGNVTPVTAVNIAPGSPSTSALTIQPTTGAGGIDVGASAGVVTISADVVASNVGSPSQTWAVDGTGANGSSLTVSGNTTFNANVIKAGAGVLTVSGALNTGSGGFTLTGGTLNANSAGALGTGTFTINGGTTVNNTSAGSVTLTGGANVWNGDFTYTGTQSLNLGTGNVTMGTNVLLTVAGNTFTVGGAIGDGGNNRSLTKAGAGALTLSGANTIGGGVTLNAGTLNIGNAAALGSNTFTVAGGTIDNSSGSAMTVAIAVAFTGNFAFTGTQNLTFSSPTVTQTLTPDINVTGALAINGNLTSAFGITKSGGGVLSLGGTNTYAGATTISAGSLVVTGSLATTGGLVFGSANGATVVGNLDLSNASASFTSGLVRTNSATANTVTVGSGRTFALTGGLTMGYDAGAGTTATFSNLTVSGAGSMSITGTTVNVGTNQAATNAAYWNDSTLDVTALAGGFSANVTNFNIGVGGTTQGPGTVLLSNTSNTLIATTLTAGNTGGNNGRGTGSLIFGTGTNTIQADTINIGMGKNTGPGVVKFASQAAGSPGTVTINNKAGTGAATINVADNNGTATGGGAVGTLDLRGHVSTVNASTLLVGRLNMASNSGGVTGNVFFDAGTFTVGTLNMSAKTAAGTGTANSTLTVGGGNFIVNTAFTLGSQATAGAATALLNITGGTFTSNVNILDGGGTNTSTITLNGGTLDLTNHTIGSATQIDVLNFQSGTLQNVAQINNGGAISKTTAGTLTLAGTNTYTGATTVSGGTLLVGGSHTGGASYTVATGGKLGGGGVITLAASAASQVLVQSGGTLAPGASTGIISIVNGLPGTGAASTLSLASGSTYAVELNGTTAGTGYDQADVTGTVNIADGSLLTVALGFTPQLTDEFVIIKNDSTDAVGGTNFFASVNGQALSFISTNLYATSVVDANGALYTVNYAGGDGNDVVLTGIPEPTSVALMAMAGLGLLGRRRRRA